MTVLTYSDLVKRLASFAAALGIFAGCTTAAVKPQPSQLQLRQAQTRFYDSVAGGSTPVMKAIIDVLQDEGFIVKNADRELGFIVAAKEADAEDDWERFATTLFAGEAARYKKSSLLEASVNVTENGQQVRVRAIFQLKILDNFGVPLSVKQISDPGYYQDFFAKVDKGRFLSRHGF